MRKSMLILLLAWWLVAPAWGAELPREVRDALPAAAEEVTEGLEDPASLSEGLSRLWDRALGYVEEAVRQSIGGGVVLLAAAVLCGIFFLWFLPSYGQGVQQADPEFTWAYWPCLIWAWLFALPIFGAMLPCWRIFGSISAPEGAFTRRNARDMRSISRLAFADALIFPAGMFVLGFMGAGSAPLTIVITPMVIFCCAAVGIVCYVLSRLIGDAAALREENDMTI